MLHNTSSTYNAKLLSLMKLVLLWRLGILVVAIFSVTASWHHSKDSELQLRRVAGIWWWRPQAMVPAENKAQPSFVGQPQHKNTFFREPFYPHQDRILIKQFISNKLPCNTFTKGLIWNYFQDFNKLINLLVASYYLHSLMECILIII